MILRVMYLFIILTGGILIFTLYKITLLYVLKVVFGIAMIGLIETILSLNNKGKKLAGFWIPFVIISILTVYLGVTLPMGMYF